MMVPVALVAYPADWLIVTMFSPEIRSPVSVALVCIQPLIVGYGLLTWLVSRQALSHVWWCACLSIRCKSGSIGQTIPDLSQAEE